MILHTQSIGNAGTEHLLGATLESPQAGDEATGWVVRVSGWVVGRTAKAVAVEVVADGGDVVTTLPVSVVRDDVASYYGESADVGACGFQGLVSVLPSAPTFELGLSAVLADGRRAPLGSVRGTRSVLLRLETPSLAPLMLTSLGRSGSTLVMDILRRHPAILVAGGYPYEFRAARYWFHELAVLTQPADHAGSAHPDTFHEALWQVGSNPFFDRLDSAAGEWLARVHPERLATFLQRCVDDLYGEIALSAGRQQARYFAEKHVPDRLQWLAWHLYPEAREVFLVRDFRDTLASILAFNAKRGYLAFGRERCGSDDEYVEMFAQSAQRLADAWTARADIGFLLRYEDLIRAPRETLDGLGDHLRQETPFELDPFSGSAGVLGFEAHRTTASGEASIGRWRHDLPGGLAEQANACLADALSLFGYPDD